MRQGRIIGLSVALVAAIIVVAGNVLAQSRLNPAIARLAAGEPALGVFAFERDVLNARVLGNSGLDFVLIDMEHRPWNGEALVQFILNMRSADGSFAAAPIVRVPANGREIHVNQWMIKQALDAGAFGVMVPHVNSAAQARNVAIAMRYPPRHDSPAQEPRGVRGFGPLLASMAWGLSGADYARRADLWPLLPDGELLLVAQIETVRAIDALAEIAAVPGVGALFLGPADLHADMGYLGQSGVPEVEVEIQRAVAAAQAAGVPIGITTTAETVAARLAQGFTFVTIGFDVTLPEGVAAAAAAVGR